MISTTHPEPGGLSGQEDKTMRSDTDTIKAEINRLSRRVMAAHSRMIKAESAGQRETELLTASELRELHSKVIDALAVILRAEYVHQSRY